MLTTNGGLMDNTKGKCRMATDKLQRPEEDENKRLTCERAY